MLAIKLQACFTGGIISERHQAKNHSRRSSGEYYIFLFAKQSSITFHDHSLVMLLRHLFLLASFASCALAWSCPTSLPYYAETDKGKCIRQRTVSMRSRDVSFFILGRLNVVLTCSAQIGCMR